MKEKISKEKIRELYREDYVSRFGALPVNRLSRLIPLLFLQPDDVVADFACGSGMMLGLIHDKIAYYHGVDFSAEFIEASRRNQYDQGIQNACFHCEAIGDFCDTNPESFDKGFAMDFSEHVYDDDWLDVLQSIKGGLKLGGRFYLHTPNADYLVEILKKHGVLPQQPEHIAVRNAQENVRLLEHAGFRDVRVDYLPHYERRQAWLHIFSFLPIVGRYFRARLFISCAR